ncbi:DUF2017 domain-containing protein [Kineococcus terrestris]|uniref:DUF2017 domain-containing protein n=1 Tax=Kineococcus terrestris TaxID=2044856 RepID=UPI0034DB722F
MATFRRSRDGLLTLDLRPVEADVLASLAREVLELLGAPGEPAQRAVDPLAEELGLADLPSFGDHEGASPAVPPEDEVLRRLLPDAYGEDDPQAAAEFRRLTEAGLRERKARAARGLLATLEPVAGQGGRVKLDADGARTWLAALNDIRLALGTRLGVSDDPDEDPFDALAEEDPERYAWAVYDFATHLQETLVRSLG